MKIFLFLLMMSNWAIADELSRNNQCISAIIKSGLSDAANLKIVSAEGTLVEDGVDSIAIFNSSGETIVRKGSCNHIDEKQTYEHKVRELIATSANVFRSGSSEYQNIVNACSKAESLEIRNAVSNNIGASASKPGVTSK